MHNAAGVGWHALDLAQKMLVRRYQSGAAAFGEGEVEAVVSRMLQLHGVGQGPVAQRCGGDKFRTPTRQEFETVERPLDPVGAPTHLKVERVCDFKDNEVRRDQRQS